MYTAPTGGGTTAALTACATIFVPSTPRTTVYVATWVAGTTKRWMTVIRSPSTVMSNGTLGGPKRLSCTTRLVPVVLSAVVHEAVRVTGPVDLG